MLLLTAAVCVAVATSVACGQVTWDATTGTSGPQDGSGTWSTSGTNWWDGTTNIGWPNLTTSSAFFGAGSGAAGTVTVSGGVTTNSITFNAAGSGTYTLSSGTITLAGSTPTITSNVNASIGSILAGSAGLVKAGNGTLTLSAANSYTGGTQIDAGAINVTNASGLGTGTVTLGASGTAFLHGTGAGGYTIANAIAGTGNVSVRSNPGGTIATSANYTTLTGTLSGFSGTLMVDPLQSAVLLGNNALSGFNARWVITNTATASGYVLSLTAGGTAQLGELSGNGNLGATNASGGTIWEVGGLATSSTFSGAFVNSVGGFGSSLRKVGSGTLTLTGPSSSTGSVNVLAGTLRIGAGGTTGSVTSMASITGSSGATVAFNRSDDYGGVFNKAITGGLALVHLGSGTLTLSASNSFTGGTQITAGAITASNRSSFGTGSIAIGSAGTATLTAVGTSTNSVTGSGMLVLNSGAGFNNTIVNYSGDLSGFTGTVRIQSAGDFVGIAGNYLSGSTARWEVNNNTGSNYLYTATGTTVSLGALSGNGRIGSNANADTTWEVGALSTSSTYSGVFVNAVSPNTGRAVLRKVGSGVLTLTGSSSATGGTQINAGVLALGNAGALGSSGTISFGGGTLRFSDSNTTNYAARILGSGSAIRIDTNGQSMSFGALGSSNTGGLVKLGAGMLTLTGSSGFSGATTVSEGLLAVDGRIGSLSAVTVAADAAIGGSGSIAGTLTGAGLVSPGNSPGILTAAQFDPSAGLDAAFEFTGLAPTYTSASSSVNDVLRLTNVSDPFAAGTFTAGNVIDVYFNVDSIANGQIYEGGFFTGLSAENLLVALDGMASFNYWAKTTGVGTRSFGGVNYVSLTSLPGITGATLQTSYGTKDFGGSVGSVTGSVTQFVIVPEPSSLAIAAVGVSLAAWAARRRQRRSTARPAESAR